MVPVCDAVGRYGGWLHGQRVRAGDLHHLQRCGQHMREGRHMVAGFGASGQCVRRLQQQQQQQQQVVGYGAHCRFGMGSG